MSDTNTCGIVTTDIIERQLELEANMVEFGKKLYEDRLREARIDGRDLTQFNPENWILKNVIEKLVAGIKRFALPRKGAGGLQRIIKVVRASDPYDLAFLTARHCINLYSSESPYQAQCIGLGATIESHINYEHFKREFPGYIKVLERELTSKDQRYRKRVIDNARKNVTHRDADGNPVVDAKGNAKVGATSETFNQDTKYQVGSSLIGILVEETGLFAMTDLFKGGKWFKTLRPTADFQAWLEAHHSEVALARPFYIPMVCPPRPWTGEYSGGYLSNEGSRRDSVIRTRRKKLLDKLVGPHLEAEVYPALNSVQNTAWRINQRILDVLVELKDSGIGGIPEGNLELQLPPKPWTTDEEYKMWTGDNASKADKEKVSDWKRRASVVYDMWHRDQSKRRALDYKLMVADWMKAETAIWFPWNMDWRGRIYPIPNFLNPQGDDTAKALLLFAVGKPLGGPGSHWLAVHGANVFGEDKIPMDDRYDWVREHDEQIKACAENPIDNRWWTEADKPYCFLAFCFEWAGFLKEGYSYECALPVAQDGSCNGLQHYSGCLCDPVGGAAVNLVPASKPSDVYGEVAAVVLPLVEADLASDDEEVRKIAQAWMDAGITRSVVKRPVMTLPYGATKSGFESQLKDFTKKEDAKLQAKCRATGVEYKAYLGEVTPHVAATYMAEKTAVAITKVVVKAAEAMDVLKKVAEVVTDACAPIEWTAPSGFKVLQLYKKRTTKRIRTLFGGIRVRVTLKEDDPSGSLNRAKACNAIAPNIIHSFDASHLVKTVRMCTDAGINSFAMVHDSYGTHACDIPVMNRLLREAFVNMYKTNLIADFIKEVSEYVPFDVAAELPEAPERGSLDIRQVLESVYFFA